MNLVVLVSVLAAVTGALTFLALDDRPLRAKLAELGKFAFVGAFIALMFALGGSHVRIP